MNYYNDNDPFCCGWLKELIAAGLLPPGDVDGRSIADVQPNDLDGYTQVHFFCGIGGWPYALTLAAWPATRPVWTGSCPCQPLSVAGLGKGSEDERHLWPEFARLIGQCRPATVLGEQVASKLGREWLAGIRLDLEQMGYAVGAADLCAAGLGAPHIRQRLFWLAQSEPNRCQGRKRTGVPVIAEGQPEPAGGSVVNGSDRLADAPNDNRRGGIGGAQARAGQDGIGRRGSASGSSNGECGGDGSTGGETLNPGVEAASRRFNSCGPLSQQTVGGLANPQRDGLGPRRAEREGFVGESALDDASSTGGLADAEHPERRQGNTARNQHDGNDAGWQETPSGLAACRPVDWRDSVFIPCTDGKWRRVPGRWVENPGGSRSGDNLGAAGGQGRQPVDTGAESLRQGHGAAGADGLDPDGGVPVRVGNAMPERPLSTIATPGTHDGVLRQSVAPDAEGRLPKDEQYRFEIEPALFPLADGLPNRVGVLRGAGNAIIPQVAAEFIRAFMEENH